MIGSLRGMVIVELSGIKDIKCAQPEVNSFE